MREAHMLLILVVSFTLLCGVNTFSVYNPTAGRWLNRDPIGEDGSLNLHVFVNNDSVNQVDVVGLKFVALKKCQFCPDDWATSGNFPYNDYNPALIAVAQRLGIPAKKLIPGYAIATQCGAGGGDHWNLYYPTQKSINWKGSILCCNTCDNTADGALYKYVCYKRP